MADSLFRDRADLSQWVIHFVHGRNPEFETLRVCGKDVLFFRPIDANPFGEEVTSGVQGTDDGEPANAFDVLKKIIRDHYIKSGWSFRSNEGRINATIYGPSSAVCFTEMPLYALEHYANWRSAPNRVSKYGIAFKRNDLFRAGARPVIYGVSSPHREVDETPVHFRLLDQSCGIGINEQYRYVCTNPDERKDWTHEREWRWALSDDSYIDDIPGMSLLLDFFSEICVIVEKTAEKEEIEDLIRDDAELPDRFRVIAIEGSVPTPLNLLRIDDIL